MSKEEWLSNTQWKLHTDSSTETTLFRCFSPWTCHWNFPQVQEEGSAVEKKWNPVFSVSTERKYGLRCMKSNSHSEEYTVSLYGFRRIFVITVHNQLSFRQKQIDKTGNSALSSIISCDFNSTVLYCTALYCTVLYYTVLYCTVLYYTILYYTVLYCNLLYCAVHY